jgi:hypothetical protein
MSTSDDQNQSDDQAEDRPIGFEEQKVIESQQQVTEPAQTQVEESFETKEPETTASEEQVNEILESSKANNIRRLISNYSGLSLLQLF